MRGAAETAFAPLNRFAQRTIDQPFQLEQIEARNAALGERQFESFLRQKFGITGVGFERMRQEEGLSQTELLQQLNKIAQQEKVQQDAARAVEIDRQKREALGQVYDVHTNVAARVFSLDTEATELLVRRADGTTSEGEFVRAEAPGRPRRPGAGQGKVRQYTRCAFWLGRRCGVAKTHTGLTCSPGGCGVPDLAEPAGYPWQPANAGHTDHHRRFTYLCFARRRREVLGQQCRGRPRR